MAIVLRQKAQEGGTTITWGTDGGIGSTQAGSLLVVVATAVDSTTVPVFTTPTGWTSAIENDNTTTGGINGTVQIFYRANAPAETVTPAFNVNSSDTSYWIMGAEYTGIGATPIDQTGIGDGSTPDTSPISSGSITTLSANEVIVTGFVFCNTTPTLSSPTSSFTIENQSHTGGKTGAYLDRIVSSTGTYSSSATTGLTGTHHEWAGVIASFVAGSVPTVNSNFLMFM